MEESITSVQECIFKRNKGYQGGVFYAENLSQISIVNSYFEDNFAFEGGVLFI
jgi:hypothetical protein